MAVCTSWTIALNVYGWTLTFLKVNWGNSLSGFHLFSIQHWEGVILVSIRLVSLSNRLTANSLKLILALGGEKARHQEVTWRAGNILSLIGEGWMTIRSFKRSFNITFIHSLSCARGASRSGVCKFFPKVNSEATPEQDNSTHLRKIMTGPPRYSPLVTN